MVIGVAKAGVTAGEMLVGKILKPDTLIKLEDLSGIALKDILKGLEGAGIKLTEKYAPKADVFEKAMGTTTSVSARVVETPAGSKILKIDNVNRSFFPNCAVENPHNISIVFDKNGACTQFVNVNKLEGGNIVNGTVLRTEKGIEKLSKFGGEPKAYQNVYLDKNANSRYFEASHKASPYTVYDMTSGNSKIDIPVDMPDNGFGSIYKQSSIKPSTVEDMYNPFSPSAVDDICNPFSSFGDDMGFGWGAGGF